MLSCNVNGARPAAHHSLSHKNNQSKHYDSKHLLWEFSSTSDWLVVQKKNTDLLYTVFPKSIWTIKIHLNWMSLNYVIKYYTKWHLYDRTNTLLK